MKRIFALIITTSLLALNASADLISRVEFPKSDSVMIRDCDHWDLLIVKFREGTGIRLRDGRFVSSLNADLQPVEVLLTEYATTRVARLFQRPEAIYEFEKQSGEQRTGRELADLNLYFAFGPPDRPTAEQLLAKLNRLEIVECAYPEPVPQLASLPDRGDRTPPDYVASQDYLEASPIGIDIAAARAYEGGRGENVKMIDVELAWVWTHGDLPDPFFQGGTQSPEQSYRDHGTAVMGEIAGVDNGFGIVGIAPDAAVGGQSIAIGAWPDNVGAYFDQASAALEPGDVWLIELHGPGPDGNYVPMEWWQANYDAIANSTAQGRICVEAGGNGSANLDATIYEGKFNRSIRDSLAIMVGAGTPYDMVPEWFTNYGSRMDANAWGSGIYTTGYGYLYSAEGENYYYTNNFGGTSGASPIVVGVCCLAQSIFKAMTRDVLDPVTLRAAITETGAPQPSPVTQYIGPRPNLAALLLHPIFNVEGVYLDRTMYACTADVVLTVRHETSGETVSVQLSSTTEPAGEIIVLDEIEPDVFRAAVMLTTNPPVSGDGLISVSHGNSLTVEYTPLSDTAIAEIDCQAPQITNLEITTISDTTFQVIWTTDEPATSILHYGTTTPNQSVSDLRLVTNHMITVEDLSACTPYVLSAESADAAGNVAVDDNSGSYYSVTTWEGILYLDEPLNSNPGWTISGGQWAFGQPTGLGGSYGEPDPTSGYTGLNVYGYNLNGDYAASIPEYHLTTTAIDLSGATGSRLSFYRWLGVEQSAYDHAYLRISTNGSTWHELWTNSSTVTDASWTYVEYDISDWADGQPTVYLRWTMGTTDYAWEYCGWNIDDVQISCLQACDPGTPTPGPTPTPECNNDGDVNLNGDITAGDAQLAFLITLGMYSPSYPEECAADCNGDGEVTAGDAQAIFLTALGLGTCVDPL